MQLNGLVAPELLSDVCLFSKQIESPIHWFLAYQRKKHFSARDVSRPEKNAGPTIASGANHWMIVVVTDLALP